MSPRPPDPIPTDTYSHRAAARLRALREAAELSIADLAARLAELKRPVPTSTLYAYDGGKIPLPLDLAPALAEVLGLADVRLLFPAEPLNCGRPHPQPYCLCKACAKARRQKPPKRRRGPAKI